MVGHAGVSLDSMPFPEHHHLVCARRIAMLDRIQSGEAVGASGTLTDDRCSVLEIKGAAR